ncbi:MAG TPA: diguanylate cyclase [Polyangiaceae bacterium]
MPRILVVDDSAAARSRICALLRARGHDMEEAASGMEAAERAFAMPPDAVVTDLMMEAMSGVQLCRVLHADPSTAHVPVVLLTAAEDRMSRYWATSAGAVAYVVKTEIEKLADVIEGLGLTATAPSQRATPAGTPASIQGRLCRLLDDALLESVIAGETRALGSATGSVELFAGIADLASAVLSYGWLAITLRDHPQFFLHARDPRRAGEEARAALLLPAEAEASILSDLRPTLGYHSAPVVLPIAFGNDTVGSLAIALHSAKASTHERSILRLLAAELAGPLRIQRLMEEARNLARTDALTGLMNRRAFTEASERELARAERYALPLSVCILDVDNFKRVNDTHGHASGDAVLVGLARILKTMARRSDLTGRWGGEEFVLLFPQTGDAGARIAGDRVRRAVAEAKFPSPAGDLTVTVSIGIAGARPPFTLEAAVANADKALYTAKSRGRNRVEIFGA